MEPFILMFVLMAAPDITDGAIMNSSVPLGIYDELEDCADAKMWLEEHQQNLPTHIYCYAVELDIKGTFSLN